MDSISYVYISWPIHGMWMIYITFEREGHKFSNTTVRALAYRTAMQQRQLRAKWLLCSTRFFAFVRSLHVKPSGPLLCSLRFVFVSTFNLQRGRAFVVGITQFEEIIFLCKGKNIDLRNWVHLFESRCIIWRIRFAYWVTKSTDIHSSYAV
jgi:hypothetical protein